MGKVYVASMNLRGKWAKRPQGALLVNVTSAQSKGSKNRRDFSPMTPVEGGYKGYWNFESYWQSGKVFEDIPPEKVKEWWRKNIQPRRRYPHSKGRRVLYAKFDGHDAQMDYITSRKMVYVPEYAQLVKDREMTKVWRETVVRGESVVVYDFDGPRDEEGHVMWVEVTESLLCEKLNDTTFPFGHGYIVAALIAGIDLDKVLHKID